MATIKDLTRMCKEAKCKDCPLSGGNADDCWVCTYPDSYPDEDIDAIVDKWVEEHPVKTYMQDFFEKFPNAERDLTNNIPKNRFIVLCRKSIYADKLPCLGGHLQSLFKCKKCWNQEMKEE